MWGGVFDSTLQSLASGFEQGHGTLHFLVDELTFLFYCGEIHLT